MQKLPGTFVGASQWRARRFVTCRMASKATSYRTWLTLDGRLRRKLPHSCPTQLQLQSTNFRCWRTSATAYSSPNLIGGLLICDRQQTDTCLIRSLILVNRRLHKHALSVRLFGFFECNGDFSPITVVVLDW